MTQLPPLPPSQMPPAPPPEEAAPPKPKKHLAFRYVLGILGVLILIAGAMANVVPVIVLVVAVYVALLTLGVVGIARSSAAIARQTANRRQAVTQLVSNLLAILILLLPASVVAPALLRSREMSKVANCGMNLSNIRKAIEIYKLQNDGQFPPNLDAILKHSDLSAKMLRCPANRSSNGSSYFYCAPEGDDPALATIVACDVAPVHISHGRTKTARNYLRADLSVQSCTESTFQQLLQNPENHRFANELAQAATLTPRERTTYTAPPSQEHRPLDSAKTSEMRPEEPGQPTVDEDELDQSPVAAEWNQANGVRK
jgi:Tfp pilus assembly major pilin PilA